MPHPIRVGVHFWPGGTPSYGAWREAVLRAEGLGVDVVFGYDHFHKPWVPSDGPDLVARQPDVNNFEGWMALASWGEITSEVEIGLLVAGMGYRNPDLLADMARTVDHISGGRLVLGVGAGWYEKDYTSYGYDFDTLRGRMNTFDEGLLRIEHRLENLTPPPLRKIPILIGGSGPRRVLPAVGRHADIWHTWMELDQYRQRNELVREHAAAAGRQDAAIERSHHWMGLDLADAYHREGVTLFTTEIKPTNEGFDLSPLDEMLAWRDASR